MSELNHHCVEAIIITDLQNCISTNSAQIGGTASQASETRIEQ